ncbi:MutS-related protein [Alienimonas californiensis]|uniref:DNA mismatch repair protein MutS n=1 Tax=Alienimonas californiensis TaxID=2527989 RepID=A0A517P3Y3_9PLAN|nr:DNA mismatch repair protein MutS [Alienimonas californiensis]QDT14081.1 DNA mismatch repair protein MutS [Alienimonas californiensis]
MSVAASAPSPPPAPIASTAAPPDSAPAPPSPARPGGAAADPAAVHAAAKTERQAAVDRWRRWDDRLSAGRGVVFLAAVAVAIGWATGSWTGWWLLGPAVAFAALCLIHEGVASKQAFAARAVTHHDHARLRIGGGLVPDADAGADLLPPDRPHAADLDLFGEAGLFRQLSCARTAGGRATLAGWLLAPAEPDEVRTRQRAAEALAGEVRLRERLALLPGDPPAPPGDPVAIVPPRPLPAGVRLAALVLGAAAVFGLGWWLIAAGSVGILLAAAGGQGALQYVFRDRVTAAGDYSERTGGGLTLLAGVLRLLERCEPPAPAVAVLRDSLNDQETGETPSEAVARLASIARRLETSRNNQFVAVASAVFALPLFHAHAIARWAETHGGRLSDWAAAAGRFEALLSLARWRFERPAFVVPRYSSESGAARFVATGLGHPLLPQADCIRNDVALAVGAPSDGSTHEDSSPGAPALLLVSGSNMSGKSTLLRAVGVNATLAGAGAAVCATSLSLAPCRVRSVMRVTDSLADGKSLFFESVRRLAGVLDDAAAAGPPVLFLLDEILQGTNSADRRIGAEAVVRTLLDRGAFGLVTTHDLALTELADDLGTRAANVHFRDHLADGRMTFDHRLRPGVVPRSNALELMRLVGIVPREG